MADLLTINHRIANANNYRLAISSVDPDPNYLYLWFGRNSAWTDENNPPTPLNSITDEFETRSNIIGAKKITITNTCFVVPRYNWETGTVYSQYDADDDDLFSKDFYVLTSSDNVYKCLDNNTGAVSTVQPTGTSTSSIETGDGYSWKFMYNLSSSVRENFLTNDWLPVPSGGQKTAFQTTVETTATYAAGTPVGGHGYNAVEELGAVYLMISQNFDADEDGVFPVNDDYRQFGLWNNPLLVDGTTPADGTAYVAASLDLNSGSIQYVENRKLITRDSEQAENIYLVLEF
jgi:hypothetical protein